MKCGVMQITQAVGSDCKVFDDIPGLKYPGLLISSPVQRCMYLRVLLVRLAWGYR